MMRFLVTFYFLKGSPTLWLPRGGRSKFISTMMIAKKRKRMNQEQRQRIESER